MKRCLPALVLLAAAACGSPETNKGTDKEAKDAADKGDGKNPVVLIKTNMGDIKVELNAEKAPITVKNFLTYVDDKHYDGTIFHRVIDGFMIQGGGFKQGFGNVRTAQELERAEKRTRDPIRNEARNGLSNVRGTIAMARTGDPHSATSQFFINVVDNSQKLDPEKFSPDGYAVFGKVIDGMEVVDKIKAVKTKAILGGAMRDVPVDEVVIESVRRVDN